MSTRLTEAMRVKNVMSMLTATPGWKELCGVLDAQIHNRRQQYELVPLESLDDVPKAEFAKGEMAALQFARNLPEVLIGTAQEVIDENKEVEQEDAESESAID